MYTKLAPYLYLYNAHFKTYLFTYLQFIGVKKDISSPIPNMFMSYFTYIVSCFSRVALSYLCLPAWLFCLNLTQ